MSAQVRPGYKLTEVGVIPEDWEVKMLKQISPIQSVGLVINPSSYYDDAGTVPMLVGSNVSENVIDWASSKRISELSNAKVGATRVFTGDLVTVRVGEPGVTAVIPPEIDGCNCASMMIVRRHYSFDSTWLCCLMNSKYGRTQVENVQYGTAQKQFNISDAVCFSYPVPPLVEQRAIATALSDMDALISGLDQLIAKKRDIKQAAMQQLLTGQQRLPGFSGEWEVKTLFEIAERKKELFDDGDWIESEHITNQGVRLIQTGNIGIGKFIEKDVRKYIYEKSFTSLRCKELRRGDLLLCRLADPAGRACVLPDIGEEKIVTSVDVTIFRPSIDTADRVYLSNLFSTPEWFRAVSDRSGGTTHKRISRGALGRIFIKIPPVKEQTAIATILSDMDSELATLETRAGKARQLKQGMMQELLTGRIRLL